MFTITQRFQGKIIVNYLELLRTDNTFKIFWYITGIANC